MPGLTVAEAILPDDRRADAVIRTSSTSHAHATQVPVPGAGTGTRMERPPPPEKVGVRMLLVEDDESDARLTRLHLDECRGVAFQVQHVTRLVGAFERLSNERFDVVLLDLDLPDSRGLSTCERLLESHPEVPVVVLTGQEDDSMGLQAVQRGAQDFLSKGHIDSETLARSVRYAMERNAMVARLESAVRDAKRSASRLKSLIARSAEGFLVLDERGTVLLANPAAEALLGLAPEEALGRALGLPAATERGDEVNLPRADGTSLPAELRSVALEWEGRPATLVSIHDLTDRKRAERVALARAVQRAFLPDRMEAEIHGLRMCARHEVCEDASGDYYDFVPLSDGRAVVAIGDVAGHGLGPALLMAHARAALRASCRASTDVARIAAEVNDALAEGMTGGRFMSLFIGAFDVEKGEIEWCNGGHIPPFLLRQDGSQERLDSTGVVLGVWPGMTYVAGKSPFHRGDLLVACSDGATEAVSSKGLQFGEDGIRMFLRDAGALSVETAVDGLRTAVRRWAGYAPVHDDLTIVAVEWAP